MAGRGRRASSPGCAAPTWHPTVAALRGRADDVVTAELRRLAQRRPDLSDEQRAEVARTVHRVVQRLLHQPTVRVRQLAAEPGGDQYAALLRELFDLEVPQTSRSTPSPTCRTADGRDCRRRLPADDRPPPEVSDEHAPAPRHPGQRPGDGPVRPRRRGAHRRHRPRRRAGRGGHRRRPLVRAGAPARRRRLRLRAARRADRRRRSTSPCTPTRICPPPRHAGLHIAAVPPRQDPRDALVARDGRTLAELPPGATVGTGALRRIAQLHALGLQLEVTPIRGNVDTRLARVLGPEADLDAVVLARAGLARLGRTDVITETLDPMLMLPAPAQGALAVECRADDSGPGRAARRARPRTVPRRGHRGTGAAGHPGGRMLRPGRRLRRTRRRRRTVTRSTCAGR